MLVKHCVSHRLAMCTCTSSEIWSHLASFYLACIHQALHTAFAIHLHQGAKWSCLSASKTRLKMSWRLIILSSFTWQFVDMSCQVYIQRRNTFTANPTNEFARGGCPRAWFLVALIGNFDKAAVGADVIVQCASPSTTSIENSSHWYHIQWCEEVCTIHVTLEKDFRSQAEQYD